jgi:hypothetical protein
MDVQTLTITLAVYPHRLRQHDLPLSCHWIRDVHAIVFPTGVHVLEDGLPITARPVGLTLAATLIATA